jgi:hypothetical protein
MYSIGGGDWKDESYSVLRPSNEEGRKFVTCGLTMEQAIEIRDELNKLCTYKKVDNSNSATQNYIDSMIDNGFAIAQETPKTEEKENPARKLANDLTNFFRKNGQMK